ncbi:MAG: diguanylate cyclase [Chitinispirillaceae bacterium]
MNSRPTVGLFISELENAYAQNLCTGVLNAAADHDVNTIVFPGKSPKAPYEHQYQFNAIYELPDRNCIDALIIASGTMINFISSEEFEQFYKKYEGIPRVSISIPIDGIPSVLIDNSVGFFQAFDHLIHHHGCKNIAFIRGPESNVEAQQRYQVYLDSLERNNIPFTEELVFQGDFTHYSASCAIEDLLASKTPFDALAAANDEMALSALKALKSKGVDVPSKVALIGFDNVQNSKFSSPSLTTVLQPIYEQGKQAFHMALDQIRGKTPENITLDTELVIRESCGCFSQSVQSINLSGRRLEEKSTDCITEIENGLLQKITLDKEKLLQCVKQIFELDGTSDNLNNACGGILKQFSEILCNKDVVENDILLLQNMVTEIRNKFLFTNPDHARKLEDLFHQLRVVIMEAALKYHSQRWEVHHNDIRGLRVILNQLVSVYKTDAALKKIVPQMKSMGISSCAVYLYDTAVIHEICDEWKFSEKVKLVMSYGKVPATSDLPYMKATEILHKEQFPSQDRFSFVVSPLFYMNEQLGFIVCEVDLMDSYLFESLSVEISSAVKLIQLIQIRQDIEMKLRGALVQLEDYNRKLNDISKTDELTGLLNRRGFLNHARHNLLVARKLKKDGILFFADLDGLKKINDTYGHEEGDHAIQQTAAILSKAFRGQDVIARLGGDEFTVFTINTTMDTMDSFRNRLTMYVNQYNENSGKEYRLSISTGAVPFSARGDESIEVLMHRADVLLYEQKRKKKLAKGENPDAM